MYPDWPDSAADLVPLPQCVGPKLKPFDFQGPQQIDFLEYLGEGRHSLVFKVKILGCIYALKLFRFDYIEDWICVEDNYDDSTDVTALATMYNYAEPFSCECRGFGRLQEEGYEELAVKCHGYILLDEEHERVMREKFKDDKCIRLEFDGNSDGPGAFEMRSLFPGKSGKPPPIRGIVKEFGQGAEHFTDKDMRRILGNIIQFHQLGIINIDVADRQLINGKICDFSTAITVPHFLMTPELSPHVPPDVWPLLEHETFLYTITDYWDFDSMVSTWNLDNEDQKQLTVRAFPNRYGREKYYDLRSTSSRDDVYTFLDPRKYDWKASLTTSPEPSAKKTPNGPRTRPRTKNHTQKISKALMPKKRRLDKWPPRWYLNCSKQEAAHLKKATYFSNTVQWTIKGDGLLHPQKRQW